MGERETRERRRVGAYVVGSLEPLEVDVERRSVIESEHPAPAARGHEERRANPAPAVLDADAEGSIGRDRRGKDGVFEHLVVEQLEGLAHGEVVA
jgi:hypothetical protein